MDKCKNDNDKRAREIEDYMIAEAQKIGVVKIQKIRKYKNPNRWNKQLTPWFTEQCQETRSKFKYMKKKYGRNHTDTQDAYAHFKKSCKRAKAAY
jgi:predicted component of viral defense system (DUF524 family)